MDTVIAGVGLLVGISILWLSLSYRATTLDMVMDNPSKYWSMEGWEPVVDKLVAEEVELLAYEVLHPNTSDLARKGFKERETKRIFSQLSYRLAVDNK